MPLLSTVYIWSSLLSRSRWIVLSTQELVVPSFSSENVLVKLFSFLMSLHGLSVGYYIYVMLNLLKKIDETRHHTYNCKKFQLYQEQILDRLHFSTYHVGRTSLSQMHWIVLHQIHWLGYCLTILERMIADDRLGFHKEGRNRLWMKQC